ncbi:MAG: hypothetical protein JWN61_2461 [Pseudonocardiales bacterium]|nr:hypothetical protein [Pseudonocardiales bacterium]
MALRLAQTSSCSIAPASSPLRSQPITNGNEDDGDPQPLPLRTMYSHWLSLCSSALRIGLSLITCRGSVDHSHLHTLNGLWITTLAVRW